MLRVTRLDKTRCWVSSELMTELRDSDGKKAVIGRSDDYWLCDNDFVSTQPTIDPENLGDLCFPRNWPAVYSESKALKSLIGKKGRIAGKRVAVVEAPAKEDLQKAKQLTFHPLKSFSNAERAEKAAGFVVVKGWAVFESADMPVGSTFIAERYWWNSLPDGKWVDFTPRPEVWHQLLLAEAVNGSPKSRSVLTHATARLATHLMRHRFKIELIACPLPEPAAASNGPRKQKEMEKKPSEEAQPMLKPVPKSMPKTKAIPVKVEADQVAAPLDYSKWKNIVDSDDDEEERPAAPSADMAEDYGVKDLMESKYARKPLPVPDYLVGNTGGGGGTNCFLSMAKLLDADFEKGGSDNTHQLAQHFSKSFHCALCDHKRQQFYRDALASVPASAFIIVLGLGSILPMLRVARRGGQGLLLDMSTKLVTIAEDILKANELALPTAAIEGGLDKEESVAKAIAKILPKDAKNVVILTEQFAHDLLSNGVVPASVAAHKAVLARAKKAQVTHIPKIVELLATPIEVRSERIAEFDIRPFNAFRHTTSNEKADFWWWPIRLDNQPLVRTELLGSSQTLCGFDFDRSMEITLDEVRRTLKMPITKRGRCNGIALWWTAKYGELEYGSQPQFAEKHGDSAPSKCDKPYRPEWKQPVHYLAGETAVFVGDTLEVLVSITPRFTVRMMQQSPFSVEAPPWVKAPREAKFSATLPILPYHFLMMTDTERMKVYQAAIRDAVRFQRERLGRRPRVLDAGAGIGLLGMTAALEGADVWLCEAVPIMRQMCREVVAVNANSIFEKRGLVQLFPPMMSHRIQVGEDVEHKFDIVVSEVMDLWCLGEGVLPTMRHAHSKLLAEGGSMLPGRLVIFAQPVEIFPWSAPEREHKVKLGTLGSNFKSKFSPIRFSQFQHRWLTDEPMAVLEIDLRNVPAPPGDGEPNLEGAKLCIRMGGKPALAAKISCCSIDKSGMLCGYGIWWAADLGNGNIITSAPTNPQRSWKQLIRWLDEPRFVHDGEEVQVLGCFNENQVNVEDIYMPREMVEQFQEQMQAEASARQTRSTTVAEAAAAIAGTSKKSRKSAASTTSASTVAAVVAGRRAAAASAVQAASTALRAGDGDDGDVLEVD